MLDAKYFFLFFFKSTNKNKIYTASMSDLSSVRGKLVVQRSNILREGKNTFASNQTGLHRFKHKFFGFQIQGSIRNDVLQIGRRAYVPNKQGKRASDSFHAQQQSNYSCSRLIKTGITQTPCAGFHTHGAGPRSIWVL